MTISEDVGAPDNHGVREWARVVQGTLIGLGVVGWFAGWLGVPEWALTAGMCWVTLVIEVWGFHAYRQCSLALIRTRVGTPCLYWLMVVVGCASWTIFSIYHALPIISGEPSGTMGAGALPAYVAFAFLALTIPFHEWAIDRIERAPIKPPTSARPPKPCSKSAPRYARPTAQSTPKRASIGRPALTVVTSAALAAMLSQAQFKPRDLAAFERAALIAKENPGMSQDALSESSGVARQTLSRWMGAVPEAFGLAA